MKLVKMDGRIIKGISIRTTNANEMNPASSKIGALYQRFDEQVPVNYKDGARVYGVFYNYDSDHTGEFSVLAGADKIGEALTAPLEQVDLVSGNYLIFEAKGLVPKVVIDTWGKIWDYFADEKSAYQRAYTTDFEYYKGPDEIDIYISIK